MAMRACLPLVLATACGRLGFDPNTEAPGDAVADAAEDASPPAANLVFVTSRQHAIAELGGGMADQLCAMHANEAGLVGTFRAWISTSATAAVARLAGARGWARTDGVPVADMPEDLAQGRLYVPIRYDERGFEATNTDPVVTATLATGAPAAENCGDFTSPTGDVIVGTPSGTAADWTQTTSQRCDSTARLYCFQIDREVAVKPSTTTGRLAFVTATTWNRSTGPASADALCNTEATAASAPGSFLAVLAATNASAASRFTDAGPTWVRRDGVALGATAADVLAGKLDAPPNVTLGNVYFGGRVVTGANSIAALASDTSSCKDWTDTDGGGSITGSSGTISSRWFDDGRFISPCSSDNVVYCFEQ